MIGEMDRQALIFLHIPKTAGTTLNQIIEWQYSPLSIFTLDPVSGFARRLSDSRRFRSNDGAVKWCVSPCILSCADRLICCTGSRKKSGCE